MVKQRITVVYIAGASRSGSTLLERTLGQIPGYISVGELRFLWDKDIDGELCGCGKPFSQCDFWSQVAQVIFGGIEKIPSEEFIRFRKSIEKNTHIPKLIFGGNKQFRVLEKKYKCNLLELYQAIHTTSNSKVIIDSSKDPRALFFLRGIPEIDLKVIHLVRDSRAVAYSWTKKRLRPEFVHAEKFMHTYVPTRSAFRWLYKNFLLESTKRFFSCYHRIFYEDFILNPKDTIQNILNSFHLKQENLDFINGNTLTLNLSSHTVSGNPFRFQQGDVKLIIDNEWTGSLPRGQKWIVNTITWSLLCYYKYFQRGRIK